MSTQTTIPTETHRVITEGFLRYLEVITPYAISSNKSRTSKEGNYYPDNLRFRCDYVTETFDDELMVWNTNRPATIEVSIVCDDRSELEPLRKLFDGLQTTASEFIMLPYINDYQEGYDGIIKVKSTQKAKYFLEKYGKKPVKTDNGANK